MVIVSIIIIAIFSVFQTRKVNDLGARFDDTRNVLLQLSGLYQTTINHASAARNYALNRQQEEIKRMEATSLALQSNFESIKSSLRQDSLESTLIDSLEKYIGKRVEISAEMVDVGRRFGLDSAASLYQGGRGREYNNAISGFIQDLQAQELKALGTIERTSTHRVSRLNYYLLGLLGVILILVTILVQKSRVDLALRRKTEAQLKNFNEQLQKQVYEKTAELTGVFERITDGFIALDKNFCFRYVNRKAGEMTNRDPATFIGRNIWEEFAGHISPVFRNALLKAMNEQVYVHFEEYSPAYNRWFEDHLYPSPEGISVFYRDITHRKMAEQAIQVSEERYRILVEEASDAIVLSDATGTILEVNNSGSEMSGYSREELIGKNLSLLVDPEELSRDPFRFDLLGFGTIVSRERNVRHKNGSSIEVEESVKLLPDGRIMAIVRNITERKKIWKENERIRYLLNQRIKELTTLYRAGQILQARNKNNDTILREMVSILPMGWQYPEIAAARITLGSLDCRTPNYDNGPHVQKTRFSLPNGEACEVEVVYLQQQPVEAEGPFLAEERNLINMIAEMLRIYFINQTAAEELLAEKNLMDSVMNSLPGVFYFYDTSGRFLRWNERFEKVTGYSGAEIANCHPLEFFEGFDRELVNQKIAEVFEKGYAEVEAEFVTRDKRRIPYYFTGVSISINGTSYLLGTGIDITERKKAEDEVRISRESLRRSYDDIRRLASSIENIREEEKIKIAREIHDELGQQLTGLKMDISWLGKKLDPADSSLQQKMHDILELLDETVRSVRRIASELRPGLLDDLGLIAAMEWQCQEFEKRSGMRIRFLFTGTDSGVSSKTATGLFRILQECLTNAARHARATEITVNLQLDESEAALQICDNGMGFDPREIESKKTLGLLGINERALMLGGKYRLISAPGKGTTVVVAVPLVRLFSTLAVRPPASGV